MLEQLKREVCEANLKLREYGLVLFTWGNVSGIDRAAGLVVIKPSGVEYDDMKPEDMAVVRLSDGQRIEGALKPSSDTPTHLELYRNFPEIGGVAHTHSRWAAIFAQARIGIRAYGTTHADYFHGEVPCTRLMTSDEISGAYELNTGKVIAEVFAGKDAMRIPAALVASHGPFTWGQTPEQAVHNAAVLEELAFTAWHSRILGAEPMQQELLDRHYLRKHGPGAYYGQR